MILSCKEFVPDGKSNQCLTDEEPTSEEYEEFEKSLSTTTKSSTTDFNGIFSSCPYGFRQNKFGVCKKIKIIF